MYEYLQLTYRYPLGALRWAQKAKAFYKNNTQTSRRERMSRAQLCAFVAPASGVGAPLFSLFSSVVRGGPSNVARLRRIEFSREYFAYSHRFCFSRWKMLVTVTAYWSNCRKWSIIHSSILIRSNVYDIDAISIICERTRTIRKDSWLL